MAPSNTIEKFYQKLSPIYNLIYNKLLFDEGRKVAVEFLSLQTGHSVLELGVGTGLTLPFYPSDCAVIGVDVSKGMLKKAKALIKQKELYNAKVLYMNARELQFKEDSFDAILGNLFISATNDPLRAIEEMKRVCKKGGKIVLMNHFRHENPRIASVEKVFSPISSRLGFDSDLCLSELLKKSKLKLHKIRKVNLFNMWTAASMINEK